MYRAALLYEALVASHTCTALLSAANEKYATVKSLLPQYIFHLLIIDQKVQECDATGDATYSTAGQQKQLIYLELTSK